MKVTVVGTGYVGLVTGVCLATKGHKVTCYDINQEKIDMCNQGRSPIEEISLEKLMYDYKENINYTTNKEFAFSEAEVIMIGVGTPENEDGSANLAYIKNAMKDMLPFMDQHAIIVMKSTVPIGMNRKLQEEYGLSHIVSNPEFLSQGRAVLDTIHPKRIVIGVDNDPYAEYKIKELYKHYEAPILVTKLESAEMIKYASNNFLALKISFINEIANLCEKVGADIDDVTEGMGYDDRIGNKFLHAGIGYGGSCFPKDTKALHWIAEENDVQLKTIKAAIDVNQGQKLILVNKLKRYFRHIEGAKIAILGLTFKPGTDDLREAPSLTIIPELLKLGVEITAWDPIAIPKFKKIFPEISFADNINQCLKEADACLILTEWDDIKKITPTDILRHMERPVILDGRNVMSPTIAEHEDIVYDAIGKSNR